MATRKCRVPGCDYAPGVENGNGKCETVSDEIKDLDQHIEMVHKAVDKDLERQKLNVEMKRLETRSSELEMQQRREGNVNVKEVKCVK